MNLQGGPANKPCLFRWPIGRSNADAPRAGSPCVRNCSPPDCLGDDQRLSVMTRGNASSLDYGFSLVAACSHVDRRL